MKTSRASTLVIAAFAGLMLRALCAAEAGAPAASGSVTGRIRDLRVRCGKLDKKLEYKEEADWTLPQSWGDCTLAVSAKRSRTFALYEF